VLIWKLGGENIQKTFTIKSDFVILLRNLCSVFQFNVAVFVHFATSPVCNVMLYRVTTDSFLVI
jgi:hypothetical protein